MTLPAPVRAILWSLAGLSASAAVGAWLRVLPPASLVRMHWAAVSVLLGAGAVLWAVECFRGHETWFALEARPLWSTALWALARWTVGAWLLGSAALYIASHEGWL